MEMASSLSAPSTSYGNLTLAQAVVTLSINAILFWLTNVIKSSSSSSSSSSSARRREASPAPPSPPPEKTPAATAAAVPDMDVVRGVMGAGGDGPAAVGFEEAAALFEEDEATVEEARAAFGVFDRDGDGFIDAAELGTVLRSLGFGSAAA